MDEIVPGCHVSVTDRRGQTHLRRAITPVVQGMDIEVVWVCRSDEWDAARADGRDPEGMPWPAEDVKPA